VDGDQSPIRPNVVSDREDEEKDDCDGEYLGATVHGELTIKTPKEARRLHGMKDNLVERGLFAKVLKTQGNAEIP